MNIVLVLFALVLSLYLVGCATQTPTSDTTGDVIAKTSSEVEKIEIFHFHGTHQCYSCKTVGAYAEETVNTFFPDEVKSGKIVFAHVNAELPENSELAKKYEVTGSSLWIGVYDEEGFHKEVNNDVWYKIDNKDDYLLYLKTIISKRLSGDLS
jgi:hypothetical protein